MTSASECFLKANNLEIAALTASSDERAACLQAAAEWRKRAHGILMEQIDPYMGRFTVAKPFPVAKGSST